jgi:hypothetical protein
MDEVRNLELVFLEAIGRSGNVTGVAEHTAAHTQAAYGLAARANTITG